MSINIYPGPVMWMQRYIINGWLTVTHIYDTDPKLITLDSGLVTQDSFHYAIVLYIFLIKRILIFLVIKVT